MKEMKLNIQLFGHTNSTENYELPQFIGTDKPTWLGDFNTAMATIDTGMSTNASNITSLGTRVTSAEGVASQASTDVASLTSTVTTLSGNVTSATTTANNAQSTATSALSTANTADGKADSNATKIGTLSNLTTTVKTDIVSAINENVTSIGNILDDLVYTENVILGNSGTIAPDGSTNEATYTLSPKTGYTAILATPATTNHGGLHLFECILENNTIRWRVSNVSGISASNRNIAVSVLYIKTSAIYVES